MFRPFCLLLTFAMILSTYSLFTGGASLPQYSHALDMAIVFFGLLITGAGSYSLGKTVTWLKDGWYQ